MEAIAERHEEENVLANEIIENLESGVNCFREIMETIDSVDQ